jgi:hypothetical protein
VSEHPSLMTTLLNCWEIIQQAVIGHVLLILLLYWNAGARCAPERKSARAKVRDRERERERENFCARGRAADF